MFGRLRASHVLEGAPADLAGALLDVVRRGRAELERGGRVEASTWLDLDDALDELLYAPSPREAPQPDRNRPEAAPAVTRPDERTQAVGR